MPRADAQEEDPLEGIFSLSEANLVIPRSPFVAILIVLRYMFLFLLSVFLSATESPYTGFRIALLILSIVPFLRMLKTERSLSISRSGIEVNRLAWPKTSFVWGDLSGIWLYWVRNTIRFSLRFKGKIDPNLELFTPHKRLELEYRMAIAKTLIDRANLIYFGTIIPNLHAYGRRYFE